MLLNFSQAFDFIHRGKIEQIREYGLPKETVTAMMMLYKNMKAIVHSLDGDANFFDIVAGVLQADTLAPYTFINCLDYILRTSLYFKKRKWFWIKKGKQMISHRNYYRYRLYRWPSASQKYT